MGAMFPSAIATAPALTASLNSWYIYVREEQREWSSEREKIWDGMIRMIIDRRHYRKIGALQDGGEKRAVAVAVGGIKRSYSTAV